MLRQSYHIQEDIIEWRRDFHMHPEIGFELQRTSKIVADELEKMGYRVKRGVGKTGVVAEIGEGGKLVIDDDRFVWDTHFGGGLDVVDFVSGRINVLIDYEAVLGRQIRAFDPNQGNYALEGSVSRRFGGTGWPLMVT